MLEMAHCSIRTTTWQRGADLTVRVQEQETSILVAFEGPGTVGAFEVIFSEVRKIESLLCAVLAIDLRGLETVDVTLLQYLFALKRAREKNAQTVVFIPLQPSHPVLEICRLLGFSLGIPETTESAL